MTETTKVRVRSTLGVTDHNLLDNRFIDNQHTMNAISGLEDALESKQDNLTAGENIQINEENVISATDTTYTAGENVSISEENVISATDTTYTAGENVSIDNGVISATDTTYTAGTNVSIDNGVISAVDTTYTAGTGIDITNGVISNTQTSAEWGNVTGNLDDQTDLKNALDAKANSADLANVATSGSYADLSNKPTIADGTLTIQKNGTTVDTFTANSSDNKTVNLVIPTTAADVNAMPDSVKYGASITVAIDSSNYQVTTTLKDQDGNTLGTAQVIDLPLESVVVSGSYDDVNKNVVLTLQNGSTITFSVADLVSGLQSEITAQNKLDADLVDDSTSVNKFVTANDKTTWDGKQDAISDLATIRAGANAGATAVQAGDLATVATSGLYSDLSGTPTIGNATLTINQGGSVVGTFTANASSDVTINLAAGGGSVDVDDSTITENAQNKIQAVGVINPQSSSAIKIWNGTEQEWNNGETTTWYNWKNGAAFAEQEYSLPSGNNWGSIAYGNGNFVVVPGNAYTTDIAYSSDNGETWTSVTMPGLASKRWWGIAYGGGKFVATSYNDTIVAYSSDGVTWSTANIPNDGMGRRTVALAYGGGRFVCMLQLDNYTCIYSDDGEHWSNGGAVISGNNMWALTYGDGKFVGIQGVNTSSNAMAYSTNGGETWYVGTMPSSKQWNSVAYGNNKFVAVADGGAFAYSSNGRDWTESTMPSSVNWMSITFSNGEFVAISSSDKLARSSDGVNWTEETLTSNTDWIAIAPGNDNLVAISKTSHLAAQITGIGSSECYTLEQNPTTASTVYSEPDVTSALTITAVGTGTITLSDTKVYNYDSTGNQTITQSVGEAHPDYLCNINEVGVKIGTTLIASAGGDDYIAGDGINITNDVISVDAISTSELSIDTVPTQNSSNLITSGGVYSVLGDVESLINAL